MDWQQLIQDKIYFDSIAGVPGTTWPIGTAGVPSDVIADVIAICAARGTRYINVRGTLVLGAAMSAYRFEGYKHLDIAHLINLNGQDVSVSSFHRLIITGTQAGAGLASYDDCMLLSMTGFNGVATLCGLITGLTLNAATISGFINCFSYLGTCTINLGNPTVANFVNLTGSFILANQTAGVTNIWATGGCQIVINNTCTGGIINIYGSAIVTNNAIGATVNDYTEQDDMAEQTAELEATDMSLITAFGSGVLASGAEQTLCSLDAVGGTKKDVKVTVYLGSDVVAPGITERWYLTSVVAPATFVLKQPENAQHDPGAACVLFREFGDLPEGLQLQFRILSAGDDTQVSYESEMTYLG